MPSAGDDRTASETAQRPSTTASFPVIRCGRASTWLAEHMADHVARYALDDGTLVVFEIDPPDGYRPAAASDITGRIREAVEPAVEAARVVVDKARAASPDEVAVKFGIKVSGEAHWWVARAATDASFEITLTWKHDDGSPHDPTTH